MRLEEKDIPRILYGGIIAGLILIAFATYIAQGLAAGCMVLGVEMIVFCFLALDTCERQKTSESPPPPRPGGRK